MKSFRAVNDTGTYDLSSGPQAASLRQFKGKSCYAQTDVEARKVIKQDAKQSILYKKSLNSSRGRQQLSS